MIDNIKFCLIKIINLLILFNLQYNNIKNISEYLIVNYANLRLIFEYDNPIVVLIVYFKQKSTIERICSLFFVNLCIPKKAIER